MPRVSILSALALAWCAATAAPALAEPPLTLDQAVAAARLHNPAVIAAGAAADGAATHVRVAQAAWLPKVEFSESWQRGNLPVYVFGSLLSQRRFTEANFAVDALNHPSALANHRASLSFEHAIFSSAIQTGMRAARVGADLAATSRSAVEHDVAVEASQAYAQALVAQAARRAAQATVAAAEDDVRRASDRRATGLVTDADVLSIQVFLAQARARAIDADAQAQIAMAALNRAMGQPLDTPHELTTVSVPPVAVPPIDALERSAIAERPEMRRAVLGERLAAIQRDGARGAFLPQVGWQGGYEWNGASFSERAGGWMVGAEVRVNVFRGWADRARLAEAQAGLVQAQAERSAADAAVRLDVRAAALRLEAARARLGVGAAAVTQARESQRIIRDRYENGLIGVTDVLRAAQALLDAELQQTAAEADVISGTAALDRAVGK